MNKIGAKVDKALSFILIILMGAIVLDILWQVITRFVINRPSAFTEELARFLLIWIGILGSAWAYRMKSHLGIDFFATKTKGKMKIAIVIFIHLSVIIFSLSVLVIGGIRIVTMTLQLNQLSASLGIRMGYVYSVIPLSGIILIFYSVLSLMTSIKEIENINISTNSIDLN